MKVMVTGGTGFVGCHTVAGLMRAGHEVRLLVRSPERVGAALDPLGVGDVESIVGDVTDPDSVERAVEGCDAAVHCASIYSLDRRMVHQVRRTNVAGTETVLGTAHRHGLDPIVHVSSFVALMGVRRAVLTPDSPPTEPPGVYSRSKADSDVVARQYQDSGAPVVITYPGSVWGPQDPHFGESCQIARNILRGFFTACPRGGAPISDVRDVARLHVFTMEQGRGPRRYLVPSVNLTLDELWASFRSVTGRKVPVVFLPPWTLLWLMKIADMSQRVLPFRLPFSHQLAYAMSTNHRFDDSLTRKESGIEPRPMDETLADTLRWMVETRQLSPGLAGQLAA